jgi:SpoVK/Ycf46/Vps4 family AAA+-type ATPase
MVAPARALPESRLAIADDLAAAIRAGSRVALIGHDADALAEVAAAALVRAGRQTARIDVADLPTAPGERDLIARLWQREALLTEAVLVLSIIDADEMALRSVGGFVARLESAVVVLARHAPPPSVPVDRRIELSRLGVDERIAIWTEALGRAHGVPAHRLASVAGQFDLPTGAIRAAAARLPAGGSVSPAKSAELLCQAARAEARPRLDDLAERIETRAGWDDLVLPPPQVAILREMTGQLAERTKVYERWGFRARLSSRGLGLSALFAGASGTGKTLAAEVMANALGLDLYRIDLSAVVSKYIGETEKNLRRIFDGAETGGAILLFDEADALFGRRSEVKDSHDRYANIEVSYLLQRMESYSGLAILTTNMKSHLDPAFLRRLRFVIDFPFPGSAERAQIWARAFPKSVPREKLEIAPLAQLNLSGGSIQSIALNASFLAAASRSKVDMMHVLQAAQREYAKLERPLTEMELRGWGVARRGRG